MANSGKLVAAVLLGAAAGATLGVLFAPDKGSELRRRITSRASELGDNLMDGINNIKDRVSSAAGEVTDRAKGAADNVAQRGQELRSSMEGGRTSRNSNM